jgi:catechol 2,3-dioxygenase-like lactoylglutathione lyase family enzyme
VSDPRIVAATLAAPADGLGDLAAFYGETLELPVVSSADRVTVSVGESSLTFAAGPAGARPFHHFALLAPGDRYDAAHAWLRHRGVELLDDGERGETTFAFDAWAALACYFHDPAGNIVEVIAHDVGEGPAHGFAASELLGLSEVGLVSADPPGAAAVLANELGLHVWSGSVPEPGSSELAFIGRKAHTLILSAAGRGWMPTGRPAESHAVEVTVSGTPLRAADLPGGELRVRRADPA